MGAWKLMGDHVTFQLESCSLVLGSREIWGQVKKTLTRKDGQYEFNQRSSTMDILRPLRKTLNCRINCDNTTAGKGCIKLHESERR